MAWHIEIDLLKEPIGKQDQFIAAYGGVTAFDFRKDDGVDATSLNAGNETLVAVRPTCTRCGGSRGASAASPGATGKTSR